MDLNEWLSTNLMDSYRQLKMLYGIVCGTCTPETCPLMTVGPKHEYSWTDGDQMWVLLNSIAFSGLKNLFRRRNILNLKKIK